MSDSLFLTNEIFLSPSQDDLEIDLLKILDDVEYKLRNGNTAVPRTKLILSKQYRKTKSKQPRTILIVSYCTFG